MKIKSLTKKDFQKAIKLIEIAFGRIGKEEARAARFYWGLKDKIKSKIFREMKYFLAVEDSKVIGICGLYSWQYHPKDIAWLGWFGVLPAYRKQRIGSKLLAHTLEYARNKGYRIFCIESTTHKDQSEARKLYKEFGFSKRGKIPNFFKNYDILYLSKKLK